MPENKTKSRKFWQRCRQSLVISIAVFAFVNFGFGNSALAKTAEECYAKLNPMEAATTQQACVTCCKDSDCTSLSCIQKMDALKKSSSEYKTYIEENVTKPAAENEAAIGKIIEETRANDTTGYYEMMDAKDAETTKNVETAKATAVGQATTSAKSEASKIKSTLRLLETASPDKVPHFTDAYIAQNWKNNDAMITDLVKKSLIARLIVITKYILGGVFMLFLGLYVIAFLGSAGKEEASKKFKDQMIWAFTGFLILALAEPFSQALSLVSLGGSSGSLLTNSDTAKISAELVGYSFRSAARLIQYILGGVALLTMGISAFRIITAVGDEETIKNSRKSLVWATIGLLVAGASVILVDNVIAPTAVLRSSVDPLAQHAALLAAGGSQAKIFVLNYVKYFQTFIGAMAVFMLFLAGFKMVSAGGEEEVINKQKKMITWIFMGLAVILVAEVFVTIFMPATGGLGEAQIASFSAQIGGFTNFLLTFSGILAVLALVVGALYVSTSAFNAEQAEKGKKILLAAALGLILTISAYAVVNTIFSSANPGGITVDVNL